LETQRGWGRAVRTAVANWYNRPVDTVAFQMAKYQQRGGWAHRDVLRLAHVKPVTQAHSRAFAWAVGKAEASVEGMPDSIALLGQFQAAQSVDDVLRLISANPKSAWEFIPTQYLGNPAVWEALLPNLPIGALLRNVARMTSSGLLKPNSNAARIVMRRLVDQDVLRKARIHPIAVLSALKVYEQGHGERSNAIWTPVQSIVDALDDAFYLSFGALKGDSQRYGIGIDISSSMAYGTIAGVAGLTPNIAAAAMAMVVARTTDQYFMIGFDTRPIDLKITATSRLPDVIRQITNVNFGGTDCAVLVKTALDRKIEVDKFVVVTDNETWAGRTHVPVMVRRYRETMKIRSKVIEVAMTASDSSICDPNDLLMLDVVGFDLATPDLIANF